jgi:hypothetical protein
MKFAILLTGHVRHSLNYQNLNKIIEEISKRGIVDIYGYTSDRKEHLTKTWYKTDISLQNQFINYDQLKDFLKFKKLVIYKDQPPSENIKDILWGKSPIAYIGVKSLYTNIYNCLNLLESDYDLIFRLRFDYYKFDNLNYTNSIISLLSKTNIDYNSFTCVKVPNLRGEDSFYFSNKQNFTSVTNYVINNFEQIEKHARSMSFYFMPEDIIKYACIQQNINFIKLGD